MTSIDSFKTLRQLNVNGTHYDYFSLPALEDGGLKEFSAAPLLTKNSIRKFIAL